MSIMKSMKQTSKKWLFRRQLENRNYVCFVRLQSICMEDRIIPRNFAFSTTDDYILTISNGGFVLFSLFFLSFLSSFFHRSECHLLLETQKTRRRYTQTICNNAANALRVRIRFSQSTCMSMLFISRSKCLKSRLSRALEYCYDSNAGIYAFFNFTAQRQHHNIFHFHNGNSSTAIY